MKFANVTKGLLLGASLVLASSAFAGEKAAIKLYEAVTVNGKTIAPGNYEAEWTGSGPDVQLSLRRGRDVVATLPGHIATTQVSYPTSGYSTKQEADGSKSLTNVFFGGKKYSIELGQQEAAAPASAKSDGSN